MKLGDGQSVIVAMAIGVLIACPFVFALTCLMRGPSASEIRDQVVLCESICKERKISTLGASAGYFSCSCERER